MLKYVKVNWGFFIYPYFVLHIWAWRQFSSSDHKINIIFILFFLLNSIILHMKFRYKQPSNFWETYVAVQHEWPWMKGQLYLCCCLIRLNISCKYYHFHLNSYRNMTILRYFQYKYIRNQTVIRHKRGQGKPWFIVCANLVGPTSSMLHTKSQGHWSFDSREGDLKGFYLIWTWRRSWSWDHKYLLYIYSFQLMEYPYEIWVQLATFWEIYFNSLLGLQYERPWLKDQRSTLTFGTCILG